MNVKFKRLGIQSQILLVFLLFTIIIVALLWVFQITFLSSFYKAIKHNEITTTANNIIENFEKEDYQKDEYADFLKNTTKNTGIDIIIADPSGKLLAQISYGYSPLVSAYNDETVFRNLYKRIVNDGGEYTEWGESKVGSGYTEYEQLIYVRATTGDSPLLVILSTSVTPVDSTVETLKIQLVCLTFVMLILSALLAVFLSKKIAKPIKVINEGAKKISLGDYNILLVPKGGKETRELANTLNLTAFELSKVENLRRELLANVSHDLRTPLTMISGYAEVMRDIPGENSPENIQVIIDESQRLTHLVNDLLDISKIEAGEASYNPKVLNLTQSVVNILSRYDKLADYNFDFYRGDDIYVYGDELKISQVIYNLVNNAITYTGDDKRIILEQSIENDFVRISVTDTGEGIEQDKLKDIWERYYKVDKSHKMAQVGTGLGLSIVKKVLQMHGGTYGVASQVGKGSTFWFTLPIYNENEDNI